MPLYMTQASYTPEAVAALAQNPEDRSEALRGLAESMGGRLLSFHYSFGDYDIVTMQEAPDDKTAAAARAACGPLDQVCGPRRGPRLDRRRAGR